MARLRVRVPQLLAASCGGLRTVEVQGGSVREALEDAIDQHPLLAVHLFEEGGGVRPHVHLFLGEDDVGGELDRAVAEGAEIVVLQAVSGG